MKDENPKKYLEAISFEERVSKKGLRYRIWTFEEVYSVNNKTEYTGKRSTKLFFGNDRDSFQIGDGFVGEIKNYKTTPHYIDGSLQNNISVVVIQGENGLDVAAKELVYYKAFPYDENGNVYKLKSSIPSSKSNASKNYKSENNESDEYQNTDSIGDEYWQEFLDELGDDAETAYWNID